MKTTAAENPLTLQDDHTILAEVDSPRYPFVRDHLLRFADLVETRDRVQVYRFTPLSIWNACAAGMSPGHVIAALRTYLKYPLPKHVTADIEHHGSRYGRIELTQDDTGLILKTDDVELAKEIWRSKSVRSHLIERLADDSFRLHAEERGPLKQALVHIGYPAQDRAGFKDGKPLGFDLRQAPNRGKRLILRPYQAAAVERFKQAGSGIVILPHGSGKTVVGMACMHQVQSDTLILTSTPCAVQHWRTELLAKTTLTKNQIGTYAKGQSKLARITIATYPTLDHPPPKTGTDAHLSMFARRHWGLLVFDEVHLIPKTVLQAVLPLQSCRRLGLSATLTMAHEKAQANLFALIGPKICDVPVRVLENDAWIPRVYCQEIRIPLPVALRVPYATAREGSKFRLASENPDKLRILQDILAQHEDAPVLILGTYVAHARRIARELELPFIAGSTSARERNSLLRGFQAGRHPALVLSQVADYAHTIPWAPVVVQISGDFGARPTEAQHLCHIMAHASPSHYYLLISGDTVEQDVAYKRQRLLREQGFDYRICEKQP